MPFSSEFYKKPKNWIWLIIVFDLFYKALINYVYFPEFINYFNDLACLVLMHSIIMTYRRENKIGAASFQLGIIFVLFFVTLIGYLINLYRPLVYIWGIRILFRFMIFFLACTLYVDEKMVEQFFEVLFYVLLLSVPLSTYQYLAGYTLDSRTAFFSAGKSIRGGVSGINVLMCIVCTYYFARYIYKKSSISKFVISMISSVYMAAIGELKVFYFELAIIIVCVILFTKISLKNILGSALGIGVLLLGMRIYDSYYGDKNTLDYASMADYAGITGRSYGSYYSLNRLTAIPYVWNNILDGASQKLFGIGAGYADAVTSEIFASGFLKENGRLGFHLWGLSLELTNIGIIGLSVYITLFLSIFVYALMAKNKNDNKSYFYVTSMIIVIIAIFSLAYNTSLILDIAAPFLYFVMAIPFILHNRKKINKAW